MNDRAAAHLAAPSPQGRCHMVIPCLVLAAGAVFGPAAAPEPKAGVDAELSKRIDGLFDRLRHPRFAERERASRELAEMGVPAVEPLRKAAASPDPEIAARAKACLPVLELNIKVARLAASLRDPQPEARIKAANGLTALHQSARRAVPDLVRALDDPDPKVRVRVIVALWNIGPDSEPAVPKLVAILKDKQAGEELRWAAATCLGYFGPGVAAEAEPVLLRMLETETILPRYAAVIALGKIGGRDERVVPSLLRLLDDPDDKIHAGAAEALGQIKKRPSAVIPALVKMLERNSRVSGDQDPLRAKERGARRFAAVLALRGFGEAAEPAVALLAEVVKDDRDDWQTRSVAIEALGAIGPKARPATAVLERFLRDGEDPVIARHAVKALEAIQRREKD